MSSWKANFSRWSVTISRVAVMQSSFRGTSGRPRHGSLDACGNSESDYRDYGAQRQRRRHPLRWSGVWIGDRLAELDDAAADVARVRVRLAVSESHVGEPEPGRG